MLLSHFRGNFLQFFPATVDLDILPRDITCLIACQKTDQLSILSIRARAPHKGQFARNVRVNVHNFRLFSPLQMHIVADGL